ncbi:MAG: type II secretion system secretin GspD [Rhodocyclales bacterium]|nr:type II secretion system secretin GspD [Rhodocyclales bacterium]
MRECTRRLTVVALLTLQLLLASAWAQKDEEGVSLTFANADIETVIRAIGKISNRNILVDPRVKGTLNIVTSKPVTAEEAYQIMLSALRMQGYSVVEDRGIVKVVPEAEAKTHSLPVSRSRGKLNGERMVTHVFHIKNESATQLLTVVRPLVSPNNSISAYANNNTLIVTDYAGNVERIAKIIDALDVPQGDIVIIPLKHTSAQDIAPLISKLMGESSLQGQPADPSQRATVAADSRLNALLVRSENPSRINSIRQLVANMDQPGAAGNIHVVYLKNADATKVAQTLRSVLTGDSRSAASGSTTSMANTGGQTQSVATATGGGEGGQMVQADRSTNSLIITASEAVYNNLRSVIDQLDRRRAQVYVEALIAEVTADNATEFGVQFQHSNLNSGGATGYGGTNFSSGGSNILGLASNPLNAAKGVNLAVAKGILTLPDGTQILNLAMLARFMETQANSNILSTPNLLMLDNEEAKIVVGQNVPFVTGQYTNTGGGTTPANPFQTIERKDVGLTLKVKPQISEGGALVLQIFQESSSVVTTSVTSANGPTTNKRSIETTAVVDDGEIIVLGGLVQDSYSTGAEKVPLLGDIPILGQLFRYDTRQRTKTNLFVFLRPMILRDGASYKAMTTDRYMYIVGQQRSLGKVGKPTSPDGDAPELPPLPQGNMPPADSPATQ